MGKKIKVVDGTKYELYSTTWCAGRKDNYKRGVIASGRKCFVDSAPNGDYQVWAEVKDGS